MAVIGTLMKTGMVTAHPEETVANVAVRMRDNEVGAVLVVHLGVLRGLFTERDLLTRVVAAGLDPARTPVGEVATRDPITVERDTHLRRCVEILNDRHIRHLPVLEGDSPVGILGARDLLGVVVEGLERLVDDQRYRNKLAEGVDPYDHIGGSYGE
jgi:CBS domain-containing protein